MQPQANSINKRQRFVATIIILLLIEMAFYGKAFGNNTFPVTSNSKNTINNNVLIKLDSRLLIAATNVIADANVVVFDNGYSNAVDGDDAIKLGISGEAFAILKDNQLLVVEGRPLISNTDTTFFSTINLLEQNYKLEFVSTNMVLQNMTAVVQDNFLGTSTPLNLSGTTTINFSVTAVAASKAVDRFKIVYNPSVLPVKFYSITAINSKNKITVDWLVEEENGIIEYIVEKSNDGRLFVPTAIVLPNTLPSVQKKYAWVDENINQQLVYYRVKSVDESGEEKYSAIVKVQLSKNIQTNIWPNPVNGNALNIQINQLVNGKLSVRLINSAGDVIVQKGFHFVNANQPLILFTLPNNIIKGKYDIEIHLNNSIKIVKTIIKL